jgi:DNA (cytosine-5)-methyltransferase 1
MKKKKIDDVVAISFFSGCGGLDIGSHMAGVPVISSLDFEEDCIKTLKKNKIFSKTKLFHEDITSFSANNFKKILNELKPKKFILIGGPPCQPFSKAGYWVGNKSRKGENDPKNMVQAYLTKIKELNPDGFLFENVESLLHPTNRQVVDKIITFISNLGYNYKMIKANAADFGVPQKRKRLIILGSKKKFTSIEPKKTHCPPEKTKKLGLLPYEGVGKFIQKFNNKKYAEKSEITKNGTYGFALKEVPVGGNYLDLTEKKGYPKPMFKYGKRFWNFLLKLDPNKPSWTIAAQPGPWVGPFHWTSRRLRVPEIAAIQTFPEDYVFYGNRRSIQKQIGNAVPPLLGKTMISYLKENI